MTALRLSVLLSGLLLATSASPVSAQRVVEGDLQQQMTPAEFTAAGLGKLNADELAALNAWLQGKVEKAAATAVEHAREEGRQEVISKNRGFLDFGSSEPIVAKFAEGFPGFGKGRIFTLDNGQQWEQVDAASLSSVRGAPRQVRITPGVMGVWYLQIEGYNTRAKVRRIK